MAMKYKIFISGVQKELKAERRAVKSSILSDVLLSDHFDVFLFEDAPARGKSSEQAYLAEVKGSDIYIGLLGESLWWLQSGRGITYGSRISGSAKAS